MIQKRYLEVNSRSNCEAPTPPPSTAIEVLSVEPGQTPGVIAVVAVRVGGIVLREVRVCNHGRGTYINFPSRKRDGKWIDLAEITSRTLRNAIEDAILASLASLGGVR